MHTNRARDGCFQGEPSRARSVIKALGMNRSVIAGSLLALLAACAKEPQADQHVASAPVCYPAHFSVSNQSSEHSSVCIRVRLGDEVVFAGDCAFETGHSRHRALMQVPSGSHSLKVQDCSTNVVLEQTVEFTRETWIAIDYWYRRASPIDGSRPPRFTVDILHEPFKWM